MCGSAIEISRKGATGMDDNTLDMAALADELEAFILESVPECETVQKYGGSLFTLKPDEKEGQFCGLFIHKQHVQISFSRGAELKDPNGLLLGSGKRRRHINYSVLEQVNFTELRKLLKRASQL